MDNCKICGFEGELKDKKCSFCQKEKGIPGPDRIKQAITELPEHWLIIPVSSAEA